MITSRVETVGRTEVATISHDGREFSALGSSVEGRNIVAYVGKSLDAWRTILTTWTGRTILDARSEVAETYRVNEFGDTGYALMIRLGRGRYFVGLSLGEGCLFRGELIEADSDEDAKFQARSAAEHWIGIDAEDDKKFQAQCAREDAEDAAEELAEWNEMNGFDDSDCD